MFWILLLFFNIPQTWLSCTLCVLVASVMKPEHAKKILWGAMVAFACWTHAHWYQPLSIIVMLPLHVLALLV